MGRGRVAVWSAAVILAALGLLPVANWSGSPLVAWWWSGVREWVVAGGTLFLLALALARVIGDRADRWGTRLYELLLAPSPRVFALLLAIVVLALTSGFAVYCFARAPFGHDEIAQRFHARLLLAGQLFAPAESHPEFFSLFGVLDHDGRWYASFPVGGAALLAAGMAVGATWLVNPLLTALTAIALYRFARTAFGEAPARASALLFALSPFVLFMGATQMNHVGTLALATIALAALATWATATTRKGVGLAAALIGVAVGGMATIRPLDALAVAAAIGLFQLTVLIRERQRAASLILQLVAGAIPVAWLLYVNARTTGDPLLFAYEALYGPGQRLGFHTDPYGVAYTPARALVLSSANLMRLNRYLFEWPLPALAPILAALVALRRPTRWDVLLLGLTGTVIGAYALYWASDSFFLGPRFLFTAIPAFVIFAARAPGLLAERLPTGTLRRAAVMLLPLCIGYAWLAPRGVSGIQMRAHEYRDGRTKLKTDIGAHVRAARLDRALVFVHEGWRARLEARLRARGFSPGEAAATLSSSDACQIQTALDAEDARALRDTIGTKTRLLVATRSPSPVSPIRGLPLDQVVYRSLDGAFTDTCRREIAADSAGTTPYGPFLGMAAFDPDGSLGGPVVFARDLGPRNALLRARFPDRAWFRYMPRRSLDDTTRAIVPY